jgi:arsenate reductase
MASTPLRVLFLCTGNAARSQIAEALLRKLSNGAVDVFSAGSDPAADVHPMTRLVLEERFGIDTSALHPKPIEPFLDDKWDFIITVCDRAAESCPSFPHDPLKIHWSFEDPVRIQGEPHQRRAFEHLATGLAARLRIWMALPEVRKRLEAGNPLEQTMD